MFAGSTRELPYIRNYEEADKFFNAHPPVKCRSQKKKEQWPANVRGLRTERTSSFPHYQLERNEIDGVVFYDVVLYRTTMARYYEPTKDADGRTVETRFYTWHHSNTSKGFMWDVVQRNWLKECKTTDGRLVAVPVGNDTVYDPTDNHCFGVREVLIDGFLDVSQSDHQVMRKKVTAESDKQRVARFKEYFATLLDLLPMKMGEFAAKCDIGYYRGRAFGGREKRHHKGDDALRRATNAYSVEEFSQALTSDAVEAFFVIAQECYSTMASKRSMAQGTASRNTYGGWVNPRHRIATEDPHALDAPITDADLRKSVSNALMSDYHVSNKTGREDLPKFMDAAEFPKTNRYY